jgi:transcriptional regulator with XRE-family HTH domain
MNLATGSAKNLKALRLARGLSQKELSDATGLTIRYISKLENSDPNVTLNVVEKASKALGCTVFDLLGESAQSGSDLDMKELDRLIRTLESIRSRSA